MLREVRRAPACDDAPRQRATAAGSTVPESQQCVAVPILNQLSSTLSSERRRLAASECDDQCALYGTIGVTQDSLLAHIDTSPGIFPALSLATCTV